VVGSSLKGSVIIYFLLPKGQHTHPNHPPRIPFINIVSDRIFIAFFFEFGYDLPSTWILWVLSEEFMKFCPNFQWRETRRLLRLDLSGSEFVHHFLTFPPTKTTRHPPEPRLYACHPPPFRYFPLILGKKKN